MLTKLTGDLFAIYTNIDSLCCILKTNELICVDYISMNKNPPRGEK